MISGHLATCREVFGAPRKGFLTFIHVVLRKAYDSVPREELWMTLAKLGLPEETIQLIRSFNQDRKEKIRLEGKTFGRFRVQNELR